MSSRRYGGLDLLKDLRRRAAEKLLEQRQGKNTYPPFQNWKMEQNAVHGGRKTLQVASDNPKAENVKIKSIK